MKTFEQFATDSLGKSLDFDGKYNSQCVDLFRFYVRDVLGYPQPLSVVGAKDFWFNYSKDLNLKNYYQQIKNAPEAIPQSGDVIIWDAWSTNAFGHIAIFIEGDVSKFISLDQNFPTLYRVTKTSHNYDNPKVLGWLRPLKNMNLIDLKKRLSDTSWSEVDEFSDLEELKLIDRADSIQTMVMKWLQSNKELTFSNAELTKEINTLMKEAKDNEEVLSKVTELVKKRDETISKLNEEIAVGKQFEIDSQKHLDKLIEKHKIEIIDRDLSLQELEESKDLEIKSLEEELDNEAELVDQMIINEKALKLEIEALKLKQPSILELLFSSIKSWLKS